MKLFLLVIGSLSMASIQAITYGELINCLEPDVSKVYVDDVLTLVTKKNIDQIKQLIYLNGALLSRSDAQINFLEEKEEKEENFLSLPSRSDTEINFLEENKEVKENFSKQKTNTVQPTASSTESETSNLWISLFEKAVDDDLSTQETTCFDSMITILEDLNKEENCKLGSNENDSDIICINSECTNVIRELKKDDFEYPDCKIDTKEMINIVQEALIDYFDATCNTSGAASMNLKFSALFLSFIILLISYV